MKMAYRVRNWREYNQALVGRGRVDLWVSQTHPKDWLAKDHPVRPGRRNIYSDDAIKALMCLKVVFSLPYRMLQGMMQSLLLMARCELPVPSYQQIQRRASKLRLSKKLSNKRPAGIIIDSSGVKVFGEGEWQKEKHRQKGKKEWKKLHIGLDPDSGEVIVSEATDSNRHDSQELPCLVARCPKSVKVVLADGAYDTKSCYAALARRGIAPIIPPRKGAIMREGEEMDKRNDAIMEIEGLGGDDAAKRLWKKLKRYGIRNLVEATFSRFKRSFGGRLFSRLKGLQELELEIKISVLNRFTRLGRPLSYAI